MNVGGIVLCGGRSSRMGRPKHLLPFGGETMLQRVVRIVQSVVSPVVVVAAPAQPLPELTGVLVARDEQEGLGPLAGLAAGLACLRPQATAAYASSCDAPLLKPAFIRRMIESLGTHELAIPREGEYHHPLAAVYLTALDERVCSLLAAGARRPLALVEACDAHIVDVESLRTIDPNLDSLRNTNRPEDYDAALRDAGLASQSH